MRGPGPIVPPPLAPALGRRGGVVISNICNQLALFRRSEAPRYAQSPPVRFLVHLLNKKVYNKSTTHRTTGSTLVTLAASGGKRNVTVCRPSVRLFVCPIFFLTLMERAAVHTQRNSPGNSVRRGPRQRKFQPDNTC